MSHKRPRSAFEADTHAPYAIFGTPLPNEAASRDDGAFLPLWKQEVRDERGRKRLHGAFTGGWSAGYFNTVGSKEGWTPSTFVSSRTNRRKDGLRLRVEDYMDDEDLADAAEAQKLQTSQTFAVLGSSDQAEARAGALAGLLRISGDTMGLRLLRRMGWKDGQGIGPKVRRSARLDLGRDGSSGPGGDTHLFAPDDAPMVQFVRKTDRKGLGHRGEARLHGLGREGVNDDDEHDDDEQDADQGARPSAGRMAKPARGAFGVGILNDTGSDDEDPYDMGPRIKYNRVIGGDKKTKNSKASAVSNPALLAPKLVPKTARAANGPGRCHDGRLPVDGFVLAKVTEDLAALLLRYAPPPVPPGWRPAKDPAAAADMSRYTSTVDAAKAAGHDPRSRGAVLGEKALPGKSVFDYLSASAQDRVAAASGKTDLPPARGEMPAGHAAPSEEEQQRALWDRAPKLDRNTAAAALSRTLGGPYADDEVKRVRYRRYLEHQANPGLRPPDKAAGMTDENFVQEMNEFYNCARIFKPMTGFMASRFTTSKGALNPEPSGAAELLSRPEPKAADPADEAAWMGMFGHMTRSVDDFSPTQLLCKRFNVKAPAHARPDGRPEPRPAGGGAAPGSAGPTVVTGGALPAPGDAPAAEAAAEAAAARQPATAEVNPDRNEAVEGGAANAKVLRAIFGDSDSE